MDRRAAIKKLGAGGAIAAGASAVLNTNNVAFAASGTCLVGVPASGAPIAVNPAPRNQSISFTEQVNATCDCGPRRANETKQWSLVSFDVADGGSVRPRGSSTASRFNLLRRSANGGGARWVDGDRFTVEIALTWECQDATQYVDARYRVDVVWPNVPATAANTSYVVVPK